MCENILFTVVFSLCVFCLIKIVVNRMKKRDILSVLMWFTIIGVVLYVIMLLLLGAMVISGIVI